MQKYNLRTLVVLIGNARGGEYTWESMYKNLLTPYHADLAVCFGKTEDKRNSLYERAKYVWEIEEYEDWGDYFMRHYNGYWKKSFMCGKETGLMGGIDKTVGSGSIIFAFRDFICRNCLNELNCYDRIILTRSDFFYFFEHPVFDNEHIWVPEGEDHCGITDRHIIFPADEARNILNIVEYMDSLTGYKEIKKLRQANPESVLLLYFKSSSVYSKLKRYDRVQFTVKLEECQTRWSYSRFCFPTNASLHIKYPTEYIDTMRNYYYKQAKDENLKLLLESYEKKINEYETDIWHLFRKLIYKIYKKYNNKN